VRVLSDADHDRGSTGQTVWLRVTLYDQLSAMCGLVSRW